MPRTFHSHADLVAADGDSLGHTDWMTITQDRVNLFADATDDHQWIHVDPARAADGPFGGAVAHGYLTLALVNRFLPDLLSVEGARMGVNVGCDRVRFPAAVKVGARIRGAGSVLSVEEKKGGTQIVVRVTIEIEGSDRPGAVVDTISRFFWG